MRTFVAFLSGLLFSLGLGLSGMTDPRNVIGFLDFGGTWRPALGFVMAGALLVYALAWRRARRMRAPAFDTQLHVPASSRISARLVVGALTFGAGWGLSGYCPGPAITSMGAVGVVGSGLVAFVGAMVIFAAITRAILDVRTADEPRAYGARR